MVYKIINNKVQAQIIRQGLRNEDEGMVQVLEGLATGTNLISAKLEGVKPGSKVSLPNAAGNPAALTIVTTQQVKG